MKNLFYSEKFQFQYGAIISWDLRRWYSNNSKFQFQYGAIISF